MFLAFGRLNSKITAQILLRSPRTQAHQNLKLFSTGPCETRMLAGIHRWVAARKESENTEKSDISVTKFKISVSKTHKFLYHGIHFSTVCLCTFVCILLLFASVCQLFCEPLTLKCKFQEGVFFERILVFFSSSPHEVSRCFPLQY